MEHFLYHLDSNSRKIMSVEKNEIKNDEQCSIIVNKTCLNVYEDH